MIVQFKPYPQELMDILGTLPVDMSVIGDEFRPKQSEARPKAPAPKVETKEPMLDHVVPVSGVIEGLDW
jgi:hypothetical protein